MVYALVWFVVKLYIYVCIMIKRMFTIFFGQINNINVEYVYAHALYVHSMNAILWQRDICHYSFYISRSGVWTLVKNNNFTVTLVSRSRIKRYVTFNVRQGSMRND